MIRIPLLLVIVICLYACSSTVKIQFDQPKDEIFTKPILKEYFKTDQRTILLRTPNQSGVVSNSSPEQTQLYNYIEQDFVRAGFIVRDRAIFEKVLTQSNDIDYSKVKELTNTDIILEIESIQKQQYVTNKYSKNGKERVSYCNFNKFPPGYKIDLKIIKVKENEIGGIYTFYNTPCVNGCDFILHKCELRLPDSGKSKNEGYSGRIIDDKSLQDFAAEITSKIIAAMK